MNSTSWSYHGEDGEKFHNNLSTGLGDSDFYGMGDTVGCGIKMQTGKMFFTKNGVSLGKGLLILRFKLDF